MPIYQYSRQFWFPSGVLAANVPARIFPLDSNALASLYTDATGTTPLANPVTTDVNGTVDFFAEEGEYWIYIDAETFRVSVGSPDLDLPEAVSKTMSSGIMSGGEISANLSNPQAIDMAAFVGYIVDEVTDPSFPQVTRVELPAQTIALSAASLARTVTWWLADVGGNIIQQGTQPTNVQRRSHLTLGVTTYIGGMVVVTQTTPVILAQPANQMADLMDALGPFSITGNLISPNGANLSINQSAGRMFARSFSHFVGGVVTRDPHAVTTQAQAPAQYRYITASGNVFGALRTTLDVANYDVGGVITPIPGGAGACSIHRVWLFGTGVASTQLAIQYGSTVYSSLATAVDALGQTGHVANPLFVGTGALIAHVIATRTATNLSDITQARIFTAGKFAVP